jgi:hypothetical protein
MTDFRELCARMADELDHYRQLLMDDRRETHALASEARAALAQPEPQGPGSYAPFIVKHYSSDDRPSIKGNGFDGLEIGEDRQEAEEFINWINARLFPGTIRPAIEPVPVAERLPGPEDCAPWPDEPDANHWCWLGKKVCGGWDWSQMGMSLKQLERSLAGSGWTHWLPHHALPVPQQEAE